MKKRIRRFEIRLTEEEYSRLESLQSNYSSVSHLVRTALAQFNDHQARQRFVLMSALFELYKKYDSEFAWAGSNLNQAVKRMHELAHEGILDERYLAEVLLPTVNTLFDFILLLKSQFEQTINDVMHD